MSAELRSFESIARELGMTKQGVFLCYVRAIGKLRKYLRAHPDLASQLRQSAEEEAEGRGMLQEAVDAVDGHVGFPPIWDWVLQPVPSTSEWRKRTLKILDSIT